MHTDRLAGPRRVDLWIRAGEFNSSLVGNGVSIGDTGGKAVASARRGRSTCGDLRWSGGRWRWSLGLLGFLRTGFAINGAKVFTPHSATDIEHRLFHLLPGPSRWWCAPSAHRLGRGAKPFVRSRCVIWVRITTGVKDYLAGIKKQLGAFRCELIENVRIILFAEEEEQLGVKRDTEPLNVFGSPLHRVKIILPSLLAGAELREDGDEGGE